MSSNRKSIFCLFFLFVIFNSFLFPQEFEGIYRLYKEKNFFVFGEKVNKYSNKKQIWQEIFLQAIKKNIFGRSEESNKYVNILLDNYKNNLHDSILSVLYEIKALNHINLFEYKKAYETALLLNSGYSYYLDSKENYNLENELNTWEILQTIPPQNIIKNGNNTFTIKKDSYGLMRLPIKINKTKYDFLFDTGANFCVIMESVARKLGFEILEKSNIEVGTSTDKKVNSKLAIAKQIELGNVIIENVIFIVLPDESLIFGDYKIEGIIGNPVLKSLGEIVISNFEFSIYEKSGICETTNLAYDGFTPIIKMSYKKDFLNFVLDTGGQETYLYYPFFEKYKNSIIGKYNAIKIKIGGAGGSVEVNGYSIGNLILYSGKEKVELKKVKLISDKLQDLGNFCHGHLGQDFFSQFRKIRINYIDMYAEFIK